MLTTSTLGHVTIFPVCMLATVVLSAKVASIAIAAVARFETASWNRALFEVLGTSPGLAPVDIAE